MFFIEILRCFHPDRHILITFAVSIDIGNAFIAHTERFTSGCAFRNFEFDFALDSRHNHFRSEGGLSVGASMEDLGKGLRSQVGTMFATREKGPRYLEMAEGYVTRVALNEQSEICGYEFVHLGKMMDFIKKGIEPAEALEKAKGHYGQFDGAAKYVDPRQE